MRRASRRSGYTLIEVMMALAVMTVGGLGVMALQQATTRGTRDARQVTIANNVNTKWLDRFRQDALRWTAAGANGVAATQFLSAAPAGELTAGAWATPGGAGADVSYGADFFGADTATGADMVFCTNYRLEWLGGQNALRVDVRTWWEKTGSTDDAVVDLSAFDACEVGAEAGVTNELNSASPRLRAVFASTVVRWNRS